MAKIVGSEIRIHVDGVLTSRTCEGRWWIVEQTSNEELSALIGVEPVPPGTVPRVCEHMLEMD